MLRHFVSYFFLISVSHPFAHAITITPLNSTNYDTTVSTPIYYFAVQSTSTCASGTDYFGIYPDNSKLVNLNNSSENSDGYHYLKFNITPTKAISDILETSTNGVAVRVEEKGDGSKALQLNGGSYFDSNDRSRLSYGTTSYATVSVYIALETLGGSVGSGLCSYLNSNNSTVYTSSTDCLATNSQTPTTVDLTIGFVDEDKTLEESDKADKTNIQIQLVNCAPSLGTSNSFTVAPGDEKITVDLQSYDYTDAVDIKGIAIFGRTDGSAPVYGTSKEGVTKVVQDEGDGLYLGKYKMSGLSNDTEYCVGIGFVNVGGFISKVYPTSYDSTKCVTPTVAEGFLNRSTCFIATAAYGNEWDGRLTTLRNFRDRILLKTSLGRKFVSWYYSWSPNASRYLWKHQDLRPIVRAALYPLVIFSYSLLWISVHHVLALVLLSCSLLFFVTGLIIRKKKSLKYEAFILILGILLFVPKGSLAAMSEVPKDKTTYDQDANQTQPYIESLKRGHQLKPQYSKTVSQDAGFSLITGSNFGVNSTTQKANDFNAVYETGEKYVFGARFFYEYQVFRDQNFGIVSPMVTATGIYASGKGIFTKLKTVDDDVRYRFIAVPFGAGVAYRFTMLRIFVPFFQVSFDGVPMLEMRNDDRPSKRAFSAAVEYTFGGALTLDWIFRDNAWALYQSNEVLHTYFTFQHTSLNSVNGPVKFDYSANYAGVTFEF